MKRVVLLCLLPTLMGSACFNVPGGDPPTSQPGDPVTDITPGSPTPNFNLNGSWRYEASGALPAGCVTIATLRLTAFDDGCSGNSLDLVNTPPAYAYGNNADVYCSYNIDPANPAMYGLWSFNLILQPDGSLKGPATRRLEPAGTVISAEVTWVRQ